jgi:hypothetical protein
LIDVELAETLAKGQCGFTAFVSKLARLANGIKFSIWSRRDDLGAC